MAKTRKPSAPTVHYYQKVCRLLDTGPLSILSEDAKLQIKHFVSEGIRIGYHHGVKSESCRTKVLSKRMNSKMGS